MTRTKDKKDKKAKPVRVKDLRRLYRAAEAELNGRKGEIKPLLGPSVLSEGRGGPESIPLGEAPGIFLGELDSSQPTVIVQELENRGDRQKALAVTALMGANADINASEPRIVVTHDGSLVAGKSALPRSAQATDGSPLSRGYVDEVIGLMQATSAASPPSSDAPTQRQS